MEDIIYYNKNSIGYNVCFVAFVKVRINMQFQNQIQTLMLVVKKDILNKILIVYPDAFVYVIVHLMLI